MTATIAYVAERISPRRLALFLSCLAVTLTALSVWGSHLQFNVRARGDATNVVYYLFDLDSERRIPTVFSSLLILVNAGFLAAIAWAVAEQRSARVALPWASLSLIFIYLAIDESIRIHEWVFDSLIPYFPIRFLHFWVIPASLIMMVFVVVFWRFVFSLPVRTRNLFILSGLVYLGGALGVETLGGLYAERFGKSNYTYHNIANVEEFAEMAGMILFGFALLTHLRELFCAKPDTCENHCLAPM